RRLLVRPRMGDGEERVDVVDLVFAEAAVGGEPVGAVALVHLAVVEPVIVTGGVHALAAAFALAATGVDLDGHALPDPVFVDAGSERDHRAHIFVPGSEVLVVRHAAEDRGGGPVIDDLEIGGADRDRVDAKEDLGLLRHRHRLVLQQQLSWIAEHPRLHALRDRIVLVGLHSGWRVHDISFRAHAIAPQRYRAWNQATPAIDPAD